MKRNLRVKKEVVKKEKFVRKEFPSLLPKNESQRLFMEGMKYDSLVVGHGSAGVGKAQPLTSSILTPHGYVKMADIKVGDKVHSLTGWTTVTGVFPQGKKQIVRFKFRDGGEVECCKEHLWTVNSSIQLNKKRKPTADRLTIEAAEIMRLLDISGKGNISVPVVSTVELPTVNHTLDPYIVGALIGDGCITTNWISIATPDTEILDQINSRLPTGCSIGDTNQLTHYISDQEATWKVRNRVTAALDEMGLLGTYSHTKFIPSQYKRGSIEQRYDLLRGLMDTDGTTDKRTGGVSYCTVSKQLAEDLREVVLSVGGKASITTATKHFTYKGEKKKGLLAYIVSINVLDKSKLFYVTRKRERVSKTDETQLRRVFDSYELLSEEECQCISVEDESHLYVTDDYLLTHNTILACYHAAKQLYTGEIKKIILIRAYQPLAGRSIGLLPGTAQEKLQGFYQQMLDYFEDCFGKASTEIHLKNGTIEVCSLETIRGRSWSDCTVICDESQNLYVQEIQALVTRMGDNCQMIFCGDSSGVQTDIKKGMDGLTYLIKIVQKYHIEDTCFVQFTPDDIVRSGITKAFVLAFEEEYNLDKTGKGILGRPYR